MSKVISDFEVVLEFMHVTVCSYSSSEHFSIAWYLFEHDNHFHILKLFFFYISS